MKIAIATTGRFHVLDLARELAALGHEISFYSILPRWRVVRFGLPAQAHRGLLPWLAPLVAVLRYGGKAANRILGPWFLRSVDSLIAHRLEPCDVFIGMSGLCVESARAARDRYGARVFIERGSQHILSQKAILDDLKALSPAAKTVADYDVQRELASYAIADRIVIPSRHVEHSFVDRGVSNGQLFRNPYGVDLTMFPPTEALQGLPPTVLFVGGWTYRKGVDLLVSAWRQLQGVKLMHVGGIGDAPLPEDLNFEHHDPVPQWQLSHFYQQAHVFVLASREEGLALVQAQALASGLPIICTDRTGGKDLIDIIGDPRWIEVVRHDDIWALADAIGRMLPRAMALSGKRDLLGHSRDQLSWASYGQRYANQLEKVFVERDRKKLED
jgi:starch synthase